MASLSVEQGTPDDSIVVAVFETPKTPEAVAAWLHRECEYRFLAVRTETLAGDLDENLSVRCPLVLGRSPAVLGAVVAESIQACRHIPSPRVK